MDELPKFGEFFKYCVNESVLSFLNRCTTGWGITRITRGLPGVFPRFQFEESVSTFTAGLFSLERGKPVPALVYVTFNGRIQVQTRAQRWGWAQSCYQIEISPESGSFSGAFLGTFDKK